MPISIDDAKTYELYQQGRTIGTFQFESAGMQKYLRELKPTVFEDLIAMNALYRPGPMGYIPQFIRRKHGEEPITYASMATKNSIKDVARVEKLPLSVSNALCKAILPVVRATPCVRRWVRRRRILSTP